MNTQILQGGNVLAIHINGMALETKHLTQTILHLGFNRGSYTNKWAHRDLTFVAQSPPPIKMACTVELKTCVFSCRSVGYNHSWNLI